MQLRFNGTLTKRAGRIDGGIVPVRLLTDREPTMYEFGDEEPTLVSELMECLPMRLPVNQIHRGASPPVGGDEVVAEIRCSEGGVDTAFKLGGDQGIGNVELCRAAGKERRLLCRATVIQRPCSMVVGFHIEFLNL